MALQNDRRRAFADERDIERGLRGGLAEKGADVTGEIDRTDERYIEFALLQRSDSHFERAQAGAFFVGDREARTPDMKRAGHTAGDDAAERAHGSIGGKRRAGGIENFIG